MGAAAERETGRETEGGPELLRVETAAGAFACEALGAPGGELVICAHGFPDHPRSFRGLARSIAGRGRRVVAPWMRGYDPSTRAGPFDAAQLGRDLVALADALSPDRAVVLVGHDWGAVAVYEALARRPGRFRRAVTLSVPHPASFARGLMTSAAQRRRSRYIALLNVPWWSDRAVARDHFGYVDALWRAWSPGYVPDPASMAELKACLARSMPAPILYYRALFRGSLGRMRERPPRIDVPTLYLHGARDGCIGPEIARGQERYFRGGLESVVVPDAGHFVHLEAPGRVADEVDAWLSSSWAAAARA